MTYRNLDSTPAAQIIVLFEHRWTGENRHHGNHI